jgi:hypothetical protein
LSSCLLPLPFVVAVAAACVGGRAVVVVVAVGIASEVAATFNRE